MEYRIGIEATLGAMIAVWLFVWIRSNSFVFKMSLVASAFLTAGLVQGPGYALMDELLLIVLSAGAFASQGMGAFRNWQPSGYLFSTEMRWPALLLIYLVMHGLYAVVSFGDWHLIRWPLLYAGLLLAWLVWNSDKLSGAAQSLPIRTLAHIAIVYFGVLLLHWLLLEVVLNIRWESMQAVTWSGSTYALFPVLFAFPVVISLMRGEGSVGHSTAYYLIALISICAQLYSSRAAFIALLLFVVVALALLTWRLAAKVTLLVFVTQISALWMGIFIYLWHAGMPLDDRVIEASRQTISSVGQYGGMVIESVRMPYAPRDSDIDRHAHALCALKMVYEANPAQMVLGSGEGQHKSVLSRCPEIKMLTGHNGAPIRSTALTAFVINYGLVGVLLFAIVCISSIWHLIRQQTKLAWISTVPFYLLAVAWGMLTDFRDNVLVYLILLFNIFLLVAPRDISLLARAPVYSHSRSAIRGFP